MKTRMTELLGIKHPIVMAGMNWITEPKIVSAVANAGGLGVLATAHLSPDEARKQIREVRQLTDKPFGINQILNAPWAKKTIDVAIEEKVPIINYSLGRPWFIEQVHAYGGKVIGTVAYVKHAQRAEQMGCDMVSVTGFEAAAHGAEPTSMVLIPLVANSIKIPMMAAGGFFDGRGLAAALVLGADGISMGTRFTVTRESIVNEKAKEAIIKATEVDTLYSNVFDGMPGRVLKSPGAEAMMRQHAFPLFGGLAGVLHVRKMMKLSWWQMFAATVTMRKADYHGHEGLNIFQQLRFAGGSLGQEKAIYDGDVNLGFIFSGQSQGGIKDIPTVADLIQRTVAEAEQVLDKAHAKAHA